MEILDLTEEEISILKDNETLFFSYLNANWYFRYPIKYIPEYIKETNVYSSFLETVNKDDPNPTMIIHCTKIPTHFHMFNIKGVLEVADFWNVDPNYIFDKMISKEFISYLLSCSKSNSYINELTNLIKYKIDSKNMFLFYINKANENIDISSPVRSNIYSNIDIYNNISQLFLINFDILDSLYLKYLNDIFGKIYEETKSLYCFLKVLHLLFNNSHNTECNHQISLILEETSSLENDRYLITGKLLCLYDNMMNKIIKMMYIDHKINKKYSSLFPWYSDESNEKKFLTISPTDEFISLYYIIINCYLDSCHFLSVNYNYGKNIVKFVRINKRFIFSIPKEKREEYFIYLFEHIEKISYEKLCEKTICLNEYIEMTVFMMKIFLNIFPELNNILINNTIWNKYENKRISDCIESEENLLILLKSYFLYFLYGWIDIIENINDF